MSKDDTQRALVPRLRFPEFREPWEHKAIAPFLQECSSRVAAPTSLPIFTSSRAGLKPQEDYYGGQTIINDGEYGVVPPDCFVFRHMSDDGVFAFHLNETGGDIAVSKEYPVFRAVDINRHFLLAKLNHSPDFKAFALSQKVGGTRTRLYFNKLQTWKTLLPSPAEQEKIAECLGSLDDLIAAEGRKLEALREHKKGLMQQLFPQEGETRPRRRFPEFQDAPEWKVNKAGTLFSQRKEKGEAELPIYSVTINDGMVLRSTFDRNFYDIEDPAGNKKVYKNDIAYNMMRMWQGACGVAAEDCMVSPAYVVLKPKEGTCPAFFDVLFKRPVTLHLLTAYSRGLTLDRLRLYFDDFTSIPLLVPTEAEQQRIADCLASLDAMIAAQAEKLDALRTHKRGLMQQLFPSAEEN